MALSLEPFAQNPKKALNRQASNHVVEQIWY